MAENAVITLFNGRTRVDLNCYGASIQRVFAPDDDGKCDDIVLGYDSEEGYASNPFYFGCIVGRVANRIGRARFHLNGKTYQLEKNNGPNHLHGGSKGLHTRKWTPTEVSDTSVTFIYLSVDGEEGYPGSVAFTVKYTLSRNVEHGDVLSVQMRGHVLSDAAVKTPISLAGHAYWNLAGHDSGDILDHELTLHNSYAYLELDQDQVPTGRLVPLDTPMDFRTRKPIGRDISLAPGGMGYDHCYAAESSKLNVDDKVYDHKASAELRCPKTGRILRVWSDAPGIQVYTGNYLDGSQVGKGGYRYTKHGGVCLETQAYPNSMNCKSFAEGGSNVVYGGFDPLTSEGISWVASPCHNNTRDDASASVYTHTMHYLFTNAAQEHTAGTAATAADVMYRLINDAVALHRNPRLDHARENGRRGVERVESSVSVEGGSSPAVLPVGTRLAPKPSSRTVLWTQEEDKYLRDLVQLHGEKRWSLVADTLRISLQSTKTDKQCRRRWVHHLSPAASKLTHTIWSPEEDKRLIEYHQRLGNKWTAISKEFGDRTENACKNRYLSIIKKRPELERYDTAPLTSVGVRRGTKTHSKIQKTSGSGPVGTK